MLGGMAGFFAMQSRVAPGLAAAEQARLELEEKYNTLKTETDPVIARAARLEKENADFLTKLEALHDELNELRSLANASVAAQPVDAAPAEAPADAEAAPEEGRRRWRGPDGEELSEEEWAARRESFRARMQESMGEFFDEEFAKSADPATQERLAAIEEYSQFFIDARQRMRDAQTDEAREALQQELADARGEMQALIQEQRASMLQDLAKRYGVPAAEQDKFVRALERTVETPFFRGGPGGFGGGRGGGSGGRGGGGREGRAGN